MHVLYNVIGATDVIAVFKTTDVSIIDPLVVSAWMLYLHIPSLIPQTYNQVRNITQMQVLYQVVTT